MVFVIGYIIVKTFYLVFSNWLERHLWSNLYIYDFQLLQYLNNLAVTFYVYSSFISFYGYYWRLKHFKKLLFQITIL